MSSSYRAMPKGIRKSTLKMSSLINIWILLTVIFNAVLYYINGVTPLFIFSCIALVVWGISSFFLYTGRTKLYIINTCSLIFVYMCMAVIILGWECGCQHFCIGFISSIIFCDFYMNRQNHISKRTIFLVCLMVFVYIGLRLWTYKYPYLYQMNSEITLRILYIINSLSGLSFLIMYSFIYFNTVCKLETELTKMANIDPLTGLYNRRKMKELIKSVQDEQDNREYHITIALLDIDKFKTINDTYGHDVGDLVLVKLSEILQNYNNQNEYFHVCRWGGEEFLIFYERYRQDRQSIIDEFDDLRKKISQTTVNDEIHFTVTIGLAFYETGKNITSLIKEADENLYKGKNNGRNQVYISDK